METAMYPSGSRHSAFARTAFGLLAGWTLLFLTTPAHAIGIGDLINGACQVDADYCTVKTIAGCLAQNEGNAEKMAACAGEADAQAKKIIDLYFAIKQPDWPKVITVGGPLVACQFLPPGPPKKIICEGLGKIAAELAAKVYKAAADGDWPAIIALLGPELACKVMPGNPVTDVLCSGAVQALVAIGKTTLEIGEGLAGGLAGAGKALLDAVTGGGDSGLSPEQYWAWYFAGWYHKITALRLAGGNYAGFISNLKDGCLNYYGPMIGPGPQICGAMQKRITDETLTIADAMKGAVGTYYDSALKGKVNDWAVEYYGKGYQTLFKEVRKQCIADLAKAFPFAQPKLTDCNIYKDFADESKCKVNTFAIAVQCKQQYPTGPAQQDCVKHETQQAQNKQSQCLSTAKLYQDQLASCQKSKAEQAFPNPSAWALACDGVEKKLDDGLKFANDVINGKLAKLSAAGCTFSKKYQNSPLPPQSLPGILLSCDTYKGYGQCETAFPTQGGDKIAHCHLDKDAADKALAKEIAGLLGAKRCHAGAKPGEIVATPAKPTGDTFAKTVICTRPWKQQKCVKLRDDLAKNAPTPSAVVCVFLDTPDFAAEKNKALQALTAFNSWVKTPSGPTPGKKTAVPCHLIWDPLGISCAGIAETPSAEPVPGIKLALCPPDPNEDGADIACYAQPADSVMVLKPVGGGPIKPEIIQAGPSPGDSSPKPFTPPALSTPAVIPSLPTGEAAGQSPTLAAPPPPMPGIAPPPTPSLAPPPVLAPALPAVQNPALPALQMPGCGIIAGRPGEFSCLSREGFDVCERQRIRPGSGVRACHLSATRAH
jgi:hypothetical protein